MLMTSSFKHTRVCSACQKYCNAGSMKRPLPCHPQSTIDKESHNNSNWTNYAKMPPCNMIKEWILTSKPVGFMQSCCTLFVLIFSGWLPLVWFTRLSVVIVKLIAKTHSNICLSCPISCSTTPGDMCTSSACTHVIRMSSTCTHVICMSSAHHLQHSSWSLWN